jgi:hypothetical protein
MGGLHAEPAEGVAGPVQEHLEQPLAQEHLRHPVPQQAGNSVGEYQGRQIQARDLFPRLCQLSGTLFNSTQYNDKVDTVCRVNQNH